MNFSDDIRITEAETFQLLKRIHTLCKGYELCKFKMVIMSSFPLGVLTYKGLNFMNTETECLDQKTLEEKPIPF